MTEQRPAPWVRKLAADGGLLLLDTASNCLSAYNRTAQLVWELLEQSGSETELVAGFAARCGIANDLACKDVRAIIRQWQWQGLLSANGSSERSTKRWTAPVSTDWLQAPTPHWVGTFTCTIRSTVFAFAIEPPNLIDFVPIFFKHLETPDALPDVRIEIREAGRTTPRLWWMVSSACGRRTRSAHRSSKSNHSRANPSRHRMACDHPRRSGCARRRGLGNSGCLRER